MQQRDGVAVRRLDRDCPPAGRHGSGERDDTASRRDNRGASSRANVDPTVKTARVDAALYRIVLTRSRCDQRTRDYLDRRTTQGMTRREAVRCLKRYVAREIYHLIRRLNPTTTCPRTA